MHTLANSKDDANPRNHLQDTASTTAPTRICLLTMW